MSKQLDRTNILNYLKEHYFEFKDKYGIDSLYLFGSFARNEQSVDSDIDLLVEFKKNTRFVDIYRVRRVSKRFASK